MTMHTIEIECLKCKYVFNANATEWRGLSLFAARCPRCGVMHTDEDVEDVQRVADFIFPKAHQLSLF